MIEKILHSANDIQTYVTELATIIDKRYKNKEVVLVCVLKGAYMFMSDISKALQTSHIIDFIQVSSYKNTTSTGVITCKKDIDVDITGKHVIVIEDVIDTGITANWLYRHLHKHNPASLAMCALFAKEQQLQEQLLFKTVLQ